MEKPQTGLLKSQPFIAELPYNDLDYCKYGMLYRQRTRIWNNIENWTPLPLCKKDCDHMVGNVHEQCAQRGPPQHLASVRRRALARNLYRVPETLTEELFGLLLFAAARFARIASASDLLFCLLVPLCTAIEYLLPS